MAGQRLPKPDIGPANGLVQSNYRGSDRSVNEAPGFTGLRHIMPEGCGFFTQKQANFARWCPLMFETFEHTADLGLRIRANELPALFADAARGLFSMIVPDLDSVRLVDELEFTIEGPVSELLLFDWLNELLYTYETRHLLFAQFEVQLSESGLRATARGEACDDHRHQLDHEVKAITYHGLKLEPADDGWLAEVIVDI